MKLDWQGEVTSVQPRFRLLRSFDRRQHNYLGYAIRVNGRIGERDGEAWLGVGKAAHEKHQFEVGQSVAGKAQSVADPRIEPVDYYKVSRLQVEPRPTPLLLPPPWRGPAPSIETYRQRGHRRLSAQTYQSASCSACIWGARMPVEITLDHWNPDQKQFRYETFCYGPKSCALYRPGANRKVPGRNGMTYEEEDRVDAEEIAHRGADE
jgi:hypothetical protein